MEIVTVSVCTFFGKKSGGHLCSMIAVVYIKLKMR